MNREIKFRAWIEKEDCNEDNPEYEMCYDLAFEEYEPINNLLNGVKNLMQYTGLKDKNGKEIYEGDIVDFGEKYGKYIIKYNESQGMYYGYPILKGEQIPIWLPATELYEVIGNVYENPELLKGD